MVGEPGKRLKALGIGRFQVMALLQAARYYKLTGDMEKAKSFGLNRAVFYAWAKYYGSKQPRISGIESELRKLLRGELTASKCPEGFTKVLGECVKISPRGYYEMGDVEQTPRDFDEQVTAKLKPLVNPGEAWEAALEYVSSFPDWVLKDPAKFYKYVYEPVRDKFFVDLIEKNSVQAPREVLERVRSLEALVNKVRRTQKTLVDYATARNNNEVSK